MTQSLNTIQLEATTEAAHFGLRLDQVLADLFPEYSRSKLKTWIQDGCVAVNGEVITIPRHKMQMDELVTVQAEMDVQVTSEAQDIALNIVYEDEHILVINKPADLVVHPGAGNPSGTVLNALLNHVPNIDKVPRAGIVHRLDKDTTGLMVVAKTIPAQTHLVDQLQRREMSREYEAVALGTMVAGGIVDAPIGRHATKRTHMAVREMGKPAVTHYRVIEKFRAYTHLRLKLETGRTHQIRVHMAHIKHPLLGDQVYGGRPRLPKGASDDFIAALRGFQRQALHAAQLSLFHPETEEWMTWKAPLPQDMQDLLKAVKQDTIDNPQDML
ncbi:pseudouridine synthase [Alteromonas sp. KUL42]|uniref:23S rRNA pseudouridine(1911/1915/1917) synthase RluD n=1 Tax=Alteromonas sp. KUL42 TaxID=2480797 RepID=UPI001035970A|nr:23S rRNA pseudouridine(1911/1915/1917) synthase RluD [Alteromonas sp. KUL42]TAP38537.1 23S rRNA pseudouridine(1911/1915/1917) synthase RluD [Alteromonas sp. KUL42]GEA05801.1 pseudouridine synthase [Alteromonas sp. KUL42]